MPMPSRVNLPIDQRSYDQLKEFKLQYQAAVGLKVTWPDFLNYLIAQAFPGEGQNGLGQRMVQLEAEVESLRGAEGGVGPSLTVGVEELTAEDMLDLAESVKQLASTTARELEKLATTQMLVEAEETTRLISTTVRELIERSPSKVSLGSWLLNLGLKLRRVNLSDDDCELIADKLAGKLRQA